MNSDDINIIFAVAVAAAAIHILLFYLTNNRNEKTRELVCAVLFSFFGCLIVRPMVYWHTQVWYRTVEFFSVFSFADMKKVNEWMNEWMTLMEMRLFLFRVKSIQHIDAHSKKAEVNEGIKTKRLLDWPERIKRTNKEYEICVIQTWLKTANECLCFLSAAHT